MNNKDLNKLQAMWRSMLFVRLVEETIADQYAKQEMRCPVHLSTGQEAVAVGVCEALGPDDVIYSNHRSHAHYLAKGGNLKALIAELYGKADGCCGGRGGSMHLYDQAAGFWGSTPIVGGTVPLAVGAAWAAKLQHASRITAVFLGDGCFEEGVVHESLNFAALHQLPILFVCENNAYSVYTNLASRQPDRPIFKLAEAHGITSMAGDGNDVTQVNDHTLASIGNIRNGGGPQFLEFSTHRWREHCGPNYDDELAYRQPGELAQWQQRCPVDKAYKVLAGHVDTQELEQIKKQLVTEIDAAFDHARNSKPAQNTGYIEYA